MTYISLDKTDYRRKIVTDWLLRLAALAIIVPLGWSFAEVAFHQLVFPFDLCFESPNLTTIKLIRDGLNPYSREVYDAMPFVFTMYTPLYHYLVAMLPIDEGNPFFFGRLLSLTCVTACGVLSFLVHRSGRGKCLTALVLPFLVFSFWPLMRNAAFLKNDMLALLLSSAAVASLSLGGRRRTLIACGLCILSVASKQSFVAAPIACLCFLALREPRKGLCFLAQLTSLAIGAAIFATLVWGSGFWFSVVGGVRQPFCFDTGLHVIMDGLRQPLFATLAFGSVFAFVHTCVHRGVLVTLRSSPFTLYLLLSWSVALLTMWKLGASSNYLFESHLSSVLWLSHWLRTELETLAPSRLLWLLICVAGLTGFETVASQPDDYTFLSSNWAETMRHRRDVLQEASRTAGNANPKFLNLVTHIDGYLVSDQIYLNDPYLYRLLWESGILSPGAVALALQGGEFDLVAVPSSFFGESPLKPHAQLLRGSLQHRYEILETSPALGYALFIRHDLTGATDH